MEPRTKLDFLDEIDLSLQVPRGESQMEGERESVCVCGEKERDRVVLQMVKVQVSVVVSLSQWVACVQLCTTLVVLLSKLSAGAAASAGLL